MEHDESIASALGWRVLVAVHVMRKLLDVFGKDVGGVLHEQQSDFGVVLVRSEMQNCQLVPVSSREMVRKKAKSDATPSSVAFLQKRPTNSEVRETLAPRCSSSRAMSTLFLIVATCKAVDWRLPSCQQKSKTLKKAQPSRKEVGSTY
jgi:hypothetical protein